VEVSEKPCWVRRATRRSWDKRPDYGRPGTVLRTSQKRKGLPWGLAEKRKETKFCEGGKGNRRHINADRFRRGKSIAKIVIDYVDGCHERMSGDNGMEEGCVGRPYIMAYNYRVSPYRSSYSPLSQSGCLIPLLLHHPFKIGGFFRGTHHRKKALEGDQKLYQLLLTRKRPLLAMRPANSEGERERLPRLI
jgi:hypothetical protein